MSDARTDWNRRDLLRTLSAATMVTSAATIVTSGPVKAADPAKKDPVAPRGKPTEFQIACMTIVYSRFPLERALTGLKGAGYKFVAWGTSHKEEGGKSVPVLAGDATIEQARELAKKCRGLGMEPVMMFGPSPDNPSALKQRIAQAGSAGIGQVLVMGSTKGNDLKAWVRNLKEVATAAKDQNVVVVVKQHGGNTGKGVECAAVTSEVDHPAIKVSYDAGNVMDYHNVNPIPDLEKCAAEVRSFCIKDHRDSPKDEDCGPGFGEIDHYKLLRPVAFTGLKMPLCCENVSAPLLPAPAAPERIDFLARHAREYLEVVIAGLQT